MASNTHTITRLHELPPDLLTAVLSPRPLPEASRLRAAGMLGAIDWGGIARDANAHAIGVLVYHRVGDLGLLDRLPDPVRAAWEADAQHAKLQHIVQRQDALRISDILSRSGVRHAFIKGFAYREWLYDPAWVRLGGDADILIDRRNVELARRLVGEEGFVQAAYSLDHQHFRPARKDEIAHAEASHHELAEFTKDHILTNPPDWLLSSAFVRRSPFAFGRAGDQPVLHSSVDIHWAVHFLFAYASPLEEIRSVEIPGQATSIPTLRLEWNLIISAFKLYFEAFDRPLFGFSHLIDLTALLEMAPQVDWSLLDGLVRQYRLEAPMFYTLSAAQNVAQRQSVPPELLEQWSEIDADVPRQPGGDALDYGDFVPFLIKKRIAVDFKHTKR